MSSFFVKYLCTLYSYPNVGEMVSRLSSFMSNDIKPILPCSCRRITERCAVSLPKPNQEYAHHRHIYTHMCNEYEGHIVPSLLTAVF